MLYSDAWGECGPHAGVVKSASVCANWIDGLGAMTVGIDMEALRGWICGLSRWSWCVR
jgi:hypothetical protein